VSAACQATDFSPRFLKLNPLLLLGELAGGQAG